MNKNFFYCIEQDLTPAPVLPLVVGVAVVILFVSMPRYIMQFNFSVLIFLGTSII